MDDTGGSKLTGIRQIVRLKELLRRWQNVTFGPKTNNNLRHNQSHAGVSPAINRRLMSRNLYCDSDEDKSLESPHDVPRGYLAVYVGPELRRFIIPTSYLSDPLFKVLLEKIEEEYGFDYSGGLTIPCEIETFKYLLKVMETHQREHAQSSNTSETTLRQREEV